MNHKVIISMLVVLVGLSWPARAAEVAVDEEAKTILQAMSDHLKASTNFTFTVADTIDEVLPSGQKLQYSHLRNVTIRRPDLMKVKTTGDINNRSFFKDGKKVTLIDDNHGVFAWIKDPGDIDEMMVFMLEKYGVSTPLADLLSADPYAVLTEEATSGTYEGIHHVGGLKCHHLAFTGIDIDWQIWVDVGAVPAPRKLLITYKKLPGEPQYTAVIEKSEILPELSKDDFKAEVPADYEKITFMASE